MQKNLDDFIAALDASPLFSAQAEALRSIQQQLSKNELIVSVIGQFKRGKSSLLNAMLGEPILPVGIVPLTTVVTEIRCGAAPQVCIDFADGVQKEIPMADLPLYCSEQWNHNNHKNVQTVRIMTPQHPFGDGITLVDTPGVGSINQENTSAAVEHLIHSDAILFVLSVDSPVSQTELDFLLKARAYASKFFFAVNKTDTVSPADLETFCAYCRSVIQENLGGEITLYPVSAKTTAGIPELMQALSSTLNASHQQLLTDSVSRKLDLLIRQIQGILDLEEKAAAAPAAELSEKLERIHEKQTELLTFADQLEVLAQHDTERLVQDIASNLAPEIESLRQSLPARCDAIRQGLAAEPLPRFKSAFQIQLDTFLKQKLRELNETGMSLLSSGYADVVARLTGQTADAEACLSDFLRQEFGIDYPAAEDSFAVSQKSDFRLHVGIRGLPRLHAELLDHLLPRRNVQRRFLTAALNQAREDVDCNVNNMLYNYRYKMQESLRPLYRELAARIHRIREELSGIAELLRSHLESEQSRQADVSSSLEQIRAVLKEYQDR